MHQRHIHQGGQSFTLCGRHKETTPVIVGMFGLFAVIDRALAEIDRDRTIVGLEDQGGTVKREDLHALVQKTLACYWSGA